MFADLEAGATGNMSSAMIPDLIRPVVMDYLDGQIEKAENQYNNILPLINYENRQCGFRAAKVIMKEGGVIGSDFCRHPIPPLEENTKAGLINLVRTFAPVALNWGK